MIGKKATAFNYKIFASKLSSFVETKFFIIITYNKVKEPEITDTDFMVTTHSGELS